MAKYAGLIGFAHVVKTAPGVRSEKITERGPYYGNIKRESMALQKATNVNTDFRATHVVEIMADDDYVNENIFAIRFVEWAGAAWTVVDVTVQRPRLLLRLGGVYHGARSESPQTRDASDTP